MASEVRFKLTGRVASKWSRSNESGEMAYGCKVILDGATVGLSLDQGQWQGCPEKGEPVEAAGTLELGQTANKYARVQQVIDKFVVQSIKRAEDGPASKRAAA